MEYSYYFQYEKNLHLFKELEELEINVENDKFHARDNSDHVKDQSSMVIVILTAPRARDTRYFHQTLVSVMEQVEASRQSHQVYVCSGDSI